MKTYKMAWRNLWRNRRRTLITVSSIFFGVLMATLMSSMQEGSYSNMIKNIVKFYSGYLQIQEEEYWDHRTLYYSFEEEDFLHKSLTGIDQIIMITPRLESFALISSGEITQTSSVIGIDPQKEEQMTNLSRWISRGDYLTTGSSNIILAEKLADNLNVDLKDTIALLGQGYYGNTVAAEFIISGILKFPNPELNKGFAYLDLNTAQTFYSSEGKLTSLALMIEEYTDLNKVKRQLDTRLDSPYIARTWKEMQPEMVQMIESDRAGGVVMKAILYIIIGFGIFGTIMMMVAERKKELGLMVAVGMQKFKLASILFQETLFIGLIGVISGILISIPLIYYFIQNPIPLTGKAAEAVINMGIEPVLAFSLEAKVFLNQLITVFLITILVAFYPVLNILNIKVIKYLQD